MDSCDTTTFCGLRDRAIILVLFDTGVRIGELADLRLQNINWTRRTMLVSGKTGERIVPFGTTTYHALRAYIALRGSTSGQDRLFVTKLAQPIGRYCARDMLGRRAKAAQLGNAGIHAHAFRHGAAVELLRAGASGFHVQRLLGHTTMEMTRNYVELIASDLTELYKQASPTDRLQLKLRTSRKRLITAHDPPKSSARTVTYRVVQADLQANIAYAGFRCRLRQRDIPVDDSKRRVVQSVKTLPPPRRNSIANVWRQVWGEHRAETIPATCPSLRKSSPSPSLVKPSPAVIPR